MDSGNSDRIKTTIKRGFRPLCACCGGGEYRKGYKNSKWVSKFKSTKARRSKPKYKDHRK